MLDAGQQGEQHMSHSKLRLVLKRSNKLWNNQVARREQLTCGVANNGGDEAYQSSIPVDIGIVEVVNFSSDGSRIQRFSRITLSHGAPPIRRVCAGHRNK